MVARRPDVARNVLDGDRSGLGTCASSRLTYLAGRKGVGRFVRDRLLRLGLTPSAGWFRPGG
jgi:hypothetical protein